MRAVRVVAVVVGAVAVAVDRRALLGRKRWLDAGERAPAAANISANGRALRGIIGERQLESGIARESGVATVLDVVTLRRWTKHQVSSSQAVPAMLTPSFNCPLMLTQSFPATTSGLPSTRCWPRLAQTSRRGPSPGVAERT